MKEKLEHLFGHILISSLHPKSDKQSAKDQKEREALQKFLEGFCVFSPSESLQTKLDDVFKPSKK